MLGLAEGQRAGRGEQVGGDMQVDGLDRLVEYLSREPAALGWHAPVASFTQPRASRCGRVRRSATWRRQPLGRGVGTSLGNADVHGGSCQPLAEPRGQEVPAPACAKSSSAASAAGEVAAAPAGGGSGPGRTRRQRRGRRAGAGRAAATAPPGGVGEVASLAGDPGERAARAPSSSAAGSRRPAGRVVHGRAGGVRRLGEPARQGLRQGQPCAGEAGEVAVSREEGTAVRPPRTSAGPVSGPRPRAAHSPARSVSRASVAASTGCARRRRGRGSATGHPRACRGAPRGRRPGQPDEARREVDLTAVSRNRPR